MIPKTELERISKLNKIGRALASERNLSKEELIEKFGFWSDLFDLKLAGLSNRDAIGKDFKHRIKRDLKRIKKAGGDVYHFYGELRLRAGKK